MDTRLTRKEIEDCINSSCDQGKSPDLRGFNLSGVNLTQIDPQGTNLYRTGYDQDTKWPEGFNPIASGAILEY